MASRVNIEQDVKAAVARVLAIVTVLLFFTLTIFVLCPPTYSAPRKFHPCVKCFFLLGRWLSEA
jgi:hypothetical protein